MRAFPYYQQPDPMGCGPTCLRMVAKYYGRNFKVQTLRKLCEINREGVSLLGINDTSEKIGFRSLGVKLSAKELKEAELPCILHWRQNHFLVLYKTLPLSFPFTANKIASGYFFKGNSISTGSNLMSARTTLLTRM